MATRPQAFGLTAEVNAKIAKKYDIRREQEALRWIEAVLDDRSLFQGIEGEINTYERLKDGIILCELMNVIVPGAVRKINRKKLPFLMMENIGSFLAACKEYGINSSDTFQTVDLYEKQNMVNVIMGIHSLGRKAQTNGYYGPSLGPRESQQNRRSFTDEQIAQGRTTIGLQMGSNKGATQSGMNFGKSRFILD